MRIPPKCFEDYRAIRRAGPYARGVRTRLTAAGFIDCGNTIHGIRMLYPGTMISGVAEPAAAAASGT
jgi:hypothetical protein